VNRGNSRRELLRLTRGKLLKDTGDGCFAVFRGILEAAQAGMVIQERVTLRNNAQSNQQARFEVHVGIDVGELVVFEDGDLRGDAANRCARICSKCPPGQVYLSEAAARMLKKNEVESSAVGAFALEGVKGKTKVHRVTNLFVWPESTANPFVWRGGITRAEDFFNREKEDG
jgi:class 3 adenylate cyclase